MSMCMGGTSPETWTEGPEFCPCCIKQGLSVKTGEGSFRLRLPFSASTSPTVLDSEDSISSAETGFCPSTTSSRFSRSCSAASRSCLCRTATSNSGPRSTRGGRAPHHTVDPAFRGGGRRDTGNDEVDVNMYRTFEYTCEYFYHFEVVSSFQFLEDCCKK